jgi:hypothetical protein
MRPLGSSSILREANSIRCRGVTSAYTEGRRISKRMKRIRMIVGLLDPNPLVRGMDPDPDLSIIKKKNRKMRPLGSSSILREANSIRCRGVTCIHTEEGELIRECPRYGKIIRCHFCNFLLLYHIFFCC